MLEENKELKVNYVLPETPDFLKKKPLTSSLSGIPKGQQISIGKLKAKIEEQDSKITSLENRLNEQSYWFEQLMFSLTGMLNNITGKYCDTYYKGKKELMTDG